MWECEVCGVQNEDSTKECRYCLNEKGSWKCPICLRENAVKETSCNYCTAPKGTDKKDTWSCEKCRGMNWNGLQKCRNCGWERGRDLEAEIMEDSTEPEPTPEAEIAEIESEISEMNVKPHVVRKKSTSAKKKTTSAKGRKKSTKKKIEEPLATKPESPRCGVQLLPIKYDLSKLNIIQNVKVLELAEVLEKTILDIKKTSRFKEISESKKEWFKDTQLTLKKIPQETDYLSVLTIIINTHIQALSTMLEYIEKVQPMSDEEYTAKLIEYMEEKNLGWVDIDSIPPTICKRLYEWACKNKKLNRAGWAFPLKACAEKGGCKYEGCECQTEQKEKEKEIKKETKENKWIDF